ncbi:phosphatidylserine/phosphatidylglycerophosphate/cardiolipin synthase-like enzyme [Elusimicrobium posterum]|uniref:phospholipase D-like domain-containing protein n=1 Tax=Elusimicrobium posterum TaxID=3116653 RepID=UPI003C72EE72
MFKKIISLFLIALLLACSTVTKKEMVLSSVDNASLRPQEVFLADDKIFISYKYEDAVFYFSAPLPQKNDGGVAAFNGQELHVLKDLPQEKDSGISIFLEDDADWRSVLTNLAYKYAPSENNSAVIIVTVFREYALWRDDKGELKVGEIKLLPKKIKIAGHYDIKTLSGDIYAEIKKSLAEKYPGRSKFLLPIKGVPRLPFIYVDTENNIVTALSLPNYYQLKKEMSALGFSIEFIYSFFVKSHFFALIKSPFTVLHRAITTTTKSIYAGFSPSLKKYNTGDYPEIEENVQGMDIEEFENYLSRRIRKDRYKAKTTLLIDGEEFFPHFMVAAAKAQKNIFIRLYIFTADPYGLAIADMLKEQSNHGIDVRVLVDELNTVLNWTKVPEQPVGKDFVMPGIKKYLKEDSKVHVRTHLNTWATFDHSKVIVIDDKIAYTGGMNFGEDYRFLWHDMMIALEGPFVLAMKERFKYAWAFAGWGGDFSAAAYYLFKEKKKFPDSDDKDMIYVRPLYTRPSDSEIFRAQRAAIRRSQKRIYIQNAYFSDDRIVKELIEARKRGVDVRVILPGENDISMMYKNNLVKANLLLENGIRVYKYPKMSHVKAALYDDWACVGSANFDKMSLYINQEMSLGISDPSFVRELEERLFEKDFAVSEEITEQFDLSWEHYVVEFFATQA